MENALSLCLKFSDTWKINIIIYPLFVFGRYQIRYCRINEGSHKNATLLIEKH